MDAFLTGLKAAVDTLGATVLLPIVIFIIAVVLGAKVGRAFRAAVTIGVAFIGINLVLGLMLGSIGDVAKAIVTNTGINATSSMSAGRPPPRSPSARRSASGSSRSASPSTSCCLLTRLTRTLNVDVWNFWHFAFIGSLATAATGSLAYGLVVAALVAALALLFADWSARAVQQFYGIPGVSVPHLASAQILPIAIVLNWIMDRIPGINRIKISTETIEKRFGVFGEPVVLGLIIGLVLGLIAYYNAGDFGTVLSKVLGTGMTLAAVMLLLPRMVKVLMEGLLPVSDAAQEFVRKRTGDRELLVGLDSAILIGHPAAIASSLILVPIAIVLSIVLPGNRVILFADLAVIPFIVAMTAPLLKGNVFRMVVVGTITLARRLLRRQRAGAAVHQRGRLVGLPAAGKRGADHLGGRRLPVDPLRGHRGDPVAWRVAGLVLLALVIAVAVRPLPPQHGRLGAGGRRRGRAGRQGRPETARY